ncbi:MAG TPA: hypothetical protein PK657_00070 [Legionella sp.]|nr:hypothetical protein [Legionella sp.]
MSEIWVYPKGSNIIYKGTFPEGWENRLEKYSPTYNKNGFLETLSLPGDDGNVITIERISRQLLNHRTTIWVYPKGSDTIYQGSFPDDWETRLEQYNPTYNKDLLETITIPVKEGEMITVERITKATCIKRATVWVYPRGSDRLYQGSFPEDWESRLEEYNATYNKNNFVETLTFPNDSNEIITIECITKAVLMYREAIWVYPEGSDKVYQGSFPEDLENRLEEHHPTYTKQGLLKTLTFRNTDEQTVTVECITKTALIKRAQVWVCPKGSNTLFMGTFPEDWENRVEEYQPTFNKKGLLKTLTFMSDKKKKVTVECISKTVLTHRTAVWVYPKGSDVIYRGTFPRDWEAQLGIYKPTYNKEGHLETLTFPDDTEQMVTIECITKQKLKERALIWVCPMGSDNVYQGSVPQDLQTHLEKYQPVYTKKRVLKTITFLDDNEQMVTVECITKKALIKRERIWVCPKGSSTIYQGSLPENWQDRIAEYHPTYTKNGLLETLTFVNDNCQRVTVEYITRHVLNQRADVVWVSPKGSNSIYQNPFPKGWENKIEDFKPTYNKMNRLETLNFPVSNGQTVTVECITKQAFKKRGPSVWVYPEGSSAIYQTPFPKDWQTRLAEYQPTYTKNGFIDTLSFRGENEQLMTIEFITQNTLNKRKNNESPKSTPKTQNARKRKAEPPSHTKAKKPKLTHESEIMNGSTFTEEYSSSNDLTQNLQQEMGDEMDCIMQKARPGVNLSIETGITNYGFFSSRVKNNNNNDNDNDKQSQLEDFFNFQD